MRNNNIVFWCNKILPLVYDESLSYYEVLCKLKDALNHMGDDIINLRNDVDHIDGHLSEIVAEWLAEHFSIPFYNVTAYGVYPGSGDNYAALHALFKDVVSKTGGVVYFPRGTYTISYTLFIPENTIVCGEGEMSEILFDETDTYMGTALSNAGSNVTIANIKVSHATTGTFHTGAQPGAIGFSDMSALMCQQTAGSHTIISDDVENLQAINIFCDGNYCLQTENGTTHTIKNVRYENIYCPNSCVSIQANNLMENIYMENIVCDLFRIHGTASNAGLVNVQANNIDCTSVFIGTGIDKNIKNIVINNLNKGTRTRNNDYYPSYYMGVFRGDCVLNDCTMINGEGENLGLSLYEGIHTFNRCYIKAGDRFCVNEANFTQANEGRNHSVFNECTLESNENVEDPQNAYLIGYGRNNNLKNLHHYVNVLWGDMHGYYKYCGLTNESANYPSGYYVNNDQLYIRGWFVVAESTAIGTLSDPAKNMPIINNQKIQFDETSENMATQKHQYATLTNGVLVPVASVTQSAYFIDTVILLERTPTDLELYNALIA